MSDEITFLHGEPELVLDAGRWKMRNGSTVEVSAVLMLHPVGPHGRINFEVWVGRCLCHNARMTWNLNGRYAARGEHEFDIVERADDDAA